MSGAHILVELNVYSCIAQCSSHALCVRDIDASVQTAMHDENRNLDQCGVRRR